jgi:hypothetical protein
VPPVVSPLSRPGSTASGWEPPATEVPGQFGGQGRLGAGLLGGWRHGRTDRTRRGRFCTSWRHRRRWLDGAADAAGVAARLTSHAGGWRPGRRGVDRSIAVLLGQRGGSVNIIVPGHRARSWMISNKRRQIWRDRRSALLALGGRHVEPGTTPYGIVAGSRGKRLQDGWWFRAAFGID